MQSLRVVILAIPALAWAQKVSVPPVNRLAPAVPSPQNVVEKMLEIADLKPDDTLYDLGSGDARVLITAAQRFGAKAVGIEISPKEVAASRERVRRLQLEDKVKVVEGDVLEADLSPANVVTMYFLTLSNDLVRPRLEQMLKPGSRVVSHDYPIRGWVPTRVEKVEAHRRIHQIYVYEMPPKKQ